MNLDDDELRATKEKEKTADEIFEELGYKKLIDNGNYIKYKKDDDNVYYFLKDVKEYYKSGEDDGMCGNTIMQELKAIYKKCQELGWLDE